MLENNLPKLSYSEDLEKSGLVRLDTRREDITQSTFKEVKCPTHPLHYMLYQSGFYHGKKRFFPPSSKNLPTLLCAAGNTAASMRTSVCFQATLGLLDREAELAYQAPPVQQVCRESLEQLDLEDSRDSQVFEVSRDQLDLQDSRDSWVEMESRVTLGLLECQVLIVLSLYNVHYIISTSHKPVTTACG